MIIPVSGLVLGVLTGALRARSRGGTGKDMLQWAAVFGIIFGVIGLFVLIMLQRSLG